MFVADLSREVTSAMLLVGYFHYIYFVFKKQTFVCRSIFRNISSLSDMPEVQFKFNICHCYYRTYSNGMYDQFNVRN